MAEAAVDLMGSRILVVDDVPANLDVLCQALEAATYRVEVANSGRSALEIAAESPPDMILMDVVMPGLDGFETCRRLRAAAATADIPVIFVSGKGETEEIVKGFQAGGEDYVVKPFQKEEVLIRVRTHLERSRLTRELRTIMPMPRLGVPSGHLALASGDVPAALSLRNLLHRKGLLRESSECSSTRAISNNDEHFRPFRTGARTVATPRDSRSTGSATRTFDGFFLFAEHFGRQAVKR